jgi:chromate transporter
MPPRMPPTLADVARLFLRLGTTAFGGPAVHVALMEDEVVRRRRWMRRDQFLDLLGATNLIPGPNSTEMAIHVGHRVAGWPGLVVAGACFIVPAAAVTLGFAWAYVRFGARPATAAILYGVKPVVIAVVAQALWRLGRVALRSPGAAAAALAGLACVVAGVNEVLALAIAGSGLAAARAAARGRGSPALAVLAGSVGAAATPAPFGLAPLFLFFAKVGSVLFGSGYVLIAFLRGDLVERWRWLTEAQLLDAIAVGQMTPGPLFTTATFVGYVLAGVPGAAVATAGIFLPAFVFVAASGPVVPHLRRSATAGAFLDGVNAASLGLMAAVAAELAHAAVVDVPTLLLAVASAVLLVRHDVPSPWIVVAGAAMGVLLRGW